MENYSANHFSEKYPFDVIRAEDFGNALYEFYEPLEGLLRKVNGVNITGSRPVFLIGGRGTGKTMVLKHLSLEMQLKSFIKKTTPNLNKSIEEISPKEMQEFLTSIEFIGIYLKYRTTEYDSIKDDFIELFKPYLSMKIAERIFDSLNIFKSSGLISSEQEEKIVEYFTRQIIYPKSNIESTFRSAIKFIKETIIHLFETIFSMSSHHSISELKNICGIPAIIHKNIFFGLPIYIFKELDFLNSKKLFILFDELEYPNDFQKRFIGQLIKDSDDTPVVFKIGSRYLPQNILVGESNEVLREIDDYRKIIITDSLNAAHCGKKDYSNLIKKILNKRLSKSNFFKKRGITNIEDLFPNVPIKDEARSLVKGREKHWKKFTTFLKKSKSMEEIDDIVNYLKYPENPIIEKLNMLLYYRKNSPQNIKKMYEKYLIAGNEKYATLYQKNSLNLLFQLYNDYSTVKKYAGINVFINLSSGIIRNALETCNEALNSAYNFGYESNSKNNVGITHQDMSAKKLAEIRYEDINRVILHNQGPKVQKFIEQIGVILRNLHLNRYLVEPEPTHFYTDFSKLEGHEKAIFELAKNYYYLQKKPPMKPKILYETTEDDYILNRVFAPKFEISYRLRGRTYISATQIQKLISGNNKEKEKVRKEIIKNNTKKVKNRIDTPELPLNYER